MANKVLEYTITATNETTQQFDQIGKSLEELEQQTQQVNKEVENVAKSFEEEGQRIVEATKEIQQEVKHTAEEVAESAKESAKEVADATKETAKEVKNENEKMANSAKTSADKADKAYSQASQNIEANTTKSISGVRKAFNSITNVVTKVVGGIKKAFTSTISVFRSVFANLHNIQSGFQMVGSAVRGAYNAVKSFVATPIKLAFDKEKMIADFATMSGSMEKAKQHYKDLVDFASTTPMTIGALSDASRLLQAFGTDITEVIPHLKTLGDIALGDEQKFQSLALVFAQVKSQGKLMGQDLLQMINSGFNPLNVMAQETGKTMSQLKDEMAEGKISFEDVARAMTKATSEGGQFYNAMQNASQTGHGLVSTLKDNVTQALTQFGSKLTELAKDEISFLIFKIQELSKNGEIEKWAERAKKALEPVVKFIGNLFDGESRKLTIEAGKESFEAAAEYLYSQIVIALKEGASYLNKTLLSSLMGSKVDAKGNVGPNILQKGYSAWDDFVHEMMGYVTFKGKGGAERHRRALDSPHISDGIMGYIQNIQTGFIRGLRGMDNNIAYNLDFDGSAVRKEAKERYNRKMDSASEKNEKATEIRRQNEQNARVDKVIQDYLDKVNADKQAEADAKAEAEKQAEADAKAKEQADKIKEAKDNVESEQKLLEDKEAEVADAREQYEKWKGIEEENKKKAQEAKAVREQIEANKFGMEDAKSFRREQEAKEARKKDENEFSKKFKEAQAQLERNGGHMEHLTQKQRDLLKMEGDRQDALKKAKEEEEKAKKAQEEAKINREHFEVLQKNAYEDVGTIKKNLAKYHEDLLKLQKVD